MFLSPYPYGYGDQQEEHCKKNVEVIQRVNVGSDHRLIRGTIKTNTRLERCKMMRARKSTVNIEVFLLEKKEFQLQLQNRFEALREGEEDAEDMVSKITNAIQEIALGTAGRQRESRRMKSLRVRQNIC